MKGIAYSLLGILICSPVFSQSVELVWEPNVEPDIAGYSVYRSNQSGQNYDLLSPSLLLQNSYRDNQLVPGNTYYYVVTATNLSGLESGFSNEVSYAVPSGTPEITVAPTSLNFGSLAAGSTATLFTTISNGGNADLTVSNLQIIGGSGFSLAASKPSTPFTVSPLGNTNIHVRFSPAFGGSDSATLRITSDDADEGMVDVSLSGTGVVHNQVPRAFNDSASTNEDTAKTVSVLVNDNLGDQPTTIQSVTTGTNGSAVIDSGATTVTYSPNANYSGSDSFTYTIRDADGETSTATVNMTITSINDPPTANNQSVTTIEDNAKGITLSGSDPDNDPLTFSIVSPPLHGKLTGSGADRIYQPHPNYHGRDSFTFRVNDGTVNSGSATASITINPVNDPPVAHSRSESVNPNRRTRLILKATDVDDYYNRLTFEILAEPEHGTLIGEAPQLFYSPDTGYLGLDSFTFVASDGKAESEPAFVQLRVREGRKRRLVHPFPLKREESFAGFAISNFGSTVAEIEYHYYDVDGFTPQSFPSPSVTSLDPGYQQAMLVEEMFAPGRIAEGPGWIEIATDESAVGSLMQFGNSDLTMMDGVVATEEINDRLILTRTFHGATAFFGQSVTTHVGIVNPNQEDVSVSLILLSGNGVEVADAGAIIPANGMIYESLGSLFEIASISSGYMAIEVTEGAGVAAFEWINLQEASTAVGLNSVRPVMGTTAYAPQFATTPDLFSQLNLINTGEEPATVSLTAFREDGTAEFAAVELLLPPKEQLIDTLANLFQTSSGSFVGSLQVTSSTGNVIGDVILGGGEEMAFATAVRLQNRPARRAVFNHMASLPNFLTGLAFFNPNGEEAEVTIRALSSSGSEIGQKTFVLVPGGRLSQVLSELIVETAGRSGGYVMIEADRAIISEMLYEVIDSGKISLLSAVPPLRAR